MINVLVTGVGSNIGQGIVKSLRMSSMQCRIIGTDMSPLSAGLFRCDKGYIVPPADGKKFIPKIIQICKDEIIDILLIGSDPEVPVFSINKLTIENNCGVIVIVSSHKLVDIAVDKWNTYTFLKKRGLNYARSALGNRKKEVDQLINKCGFPLVVKPRKRGGSKNVFVVRNSDDLAYAIKIAEDPIVQEYLGFENEEYTSGVFFTKDSKAKGIITLKRQLLCGTTYRAFVDYYKKVKEEVRKVADALEKLAAIGSINIQMRLTKKGAVTFEINPRFSGTTVFRAKMGFNEPESAIKNFLFDEEIAELQYRRGVVMRYWEEVYTSVEEFERLKKDGKIEHSKSEVIELL